MRPLSSSVAGSSRELVHFDHSFLDFLLRSKAPQRSYSCHISSSPWIISYIISYIILLYQWNDTMSADQLFADKYIYMIYRKSRPLKTLIGKINSCRHLFCSFILYLMFALGRRFFSLVASRLVSSSLQSSGKPIYCFDHDTIQCRGLTFTEIVCLPSIQRAINAAFARGIGIIRSWVEAHIRARCYPASSGVPKLLESSR